MSKLNKAKFNEMREVVSRCTYKDGWGIRLLVDNSEPTLRPYLQLRVQGHDSISGEPAEWVSGKRYLSTFMCRQEIVGAVFALIKDAEMHELHEWFRYKGRAIYNPHLDPDVLAEVASKAESFNSRTDSMTNA